MGKRKNLDAVTIFAKLREEYNETHNDQLSQAGLGKKFGLSKSTVSRIENGEISPSLDILKKYSEHFGCSTDFLTGKVNSEDVKNSTAIKALGLSPQTVDTLRLMSAGIYNDIVNAIFGDKREANYFFQQIILYMNMKATGEHIDPILETSLLINFKNFFETIVFPKINSYMATEEQRKKIEEHLYLDGDLPEIK